MVLEWRFRIQRMERKGIIPHAMIFYVYDRDGRGDVVL